MNHRKAVAFLIAHVAFLHKDFKVDPSRVRHPDPAWEKLNWVVSAFGFEGLSA